MKSAATSRAGVALDWIAAAILVLGSGTVCLAQLQIADQSNSATAEVARNPSKIPTRTPIKHLIVIVGENHSFDNVFATYVPSDPTQQVWNLLSRGIVNQSGGPGPNFSMAMQHRATDTVGYSLSPIQTGTFKDLPQPNTTLNALPAPPCLVSRLLTEQGANPSGIQFCSDPGLASSTQRLVSAGGTGQSFYAPELKPSVFPVPDCRYSSTLDDGPFPLVAASSLNECGKPFLDLIPAIVPTRFSDNTGDPVHRFFQMWQQSDCAVANITEQNPSGCNHDLYTWVATSVGLQITKDQKPPTDDQGTFQGGIAMGFYNMATGDYPFFQTLAQNFAINDNYHQFAMGGSGINSQSIGTADVYYATDANGSPVSPPADLIADPDPQIDSNNFYKNTGPGDGTGHGDLENTSTGGFVDCSDPSQPGVAPIQNYLDSLPYKPFNDGNCAASVFYQVDNEYPSYDHEGNPVETSNEFPAGPKFAIGPQTIPTIGDALSAKRISWKYYGEGIKRAGSPAIANELYCAICNPFQFSRSIMTTSLKANLQDFDSLFRDIATSGVPAVSFVKPDALVDGHPGTSTPPLFEAMCGKIIAAVTRNRKLWRNTAILITFDESGGWYDSGYIQPIDFFGDGPRTVMIAVSRYAKPGFVDHTYSDHASIVKFIEKNWNLPPLSARSRDNLPNPSANPAAPYVPTNSPAIGDLTTMFNF